MDHVTSIILQEGSKSSGLGDNLCELKSFSFGHNNKSQGSAAASLSKLRTATGAISYREQKDIPAN